MRSFSFDGFSLGRCNTRMTVGDLVRRCEHPALQVSAFDGKPYCEACVEIAEWVVDKIDAVAQLNGVERVGPPPAIRTN